MPFLAATTDQAGHRTALRALSWRCVLGSLDQLPLKLAEGVALELHRGGQPHYWWLIAAQ